MTKFLSNVLLAVVLMMAVLPGTAQAQGRIATVDLKKVFDKYWKRIQADAAVKERAASMEKEHTNMMSEWKKSKEEYQTLLASANDQAVSAEEREKRKKNAEDKLKQIKATEDTISQFEKSARTTLDEQLKRMRENILGEIKTVITAKAQAANYNLVIDTAAETAHLTPVVLYANNRDNDLTESVLAQLNAAAPSDITSKAEQKKK